MSHWAKCRKARPVKTLTYLGGSARSTRPLIIAGKYLHDGRLVLIDRKNSVLLITNTTDETTQKIDLKGPLFPHDTEAKEQDNGKMKPNIVNTAGHCRENVGDTKRESSGETTAEHSTNLVYARVPLPVKSHKPERGSYKEENIKPSDVNNGFDNNQLLITFTGKDFSFGVIYTTETKQNGLVLEKTWTVKVMDRTRSIVVLGKDHFCADTQYQIAILNKSGDIESLHRRSKRDRGGLLMSDGMARFFYGDGDEYIGCHWDGRNVTEILRFSDLRMTFPRGSAIDGSGGIIVCCDSSHNIFRISSDGRESEVIVFDRTKSFGDKDFHPNGKVFVTTFWGETKLPILFQIEA